MGDSCVNELCQCCHAKSLSSKQASEAPRSSSDPQNPRLMSLKILITISDSIVTPNVSNLFTGF